ncbi:MAG: TonB-dependent receptor [Caulobacterales bacterium]
MKRNLFCGASAVSVAVLTLAWASPGLAATATAAAEASAPATTIGELVVYAEKREEKIEEVPVAISAFSAKERDLIGIKTTQDLSDFTPGLSYYSIADRAYIRGIGRNTVNLATASGVATYYNGVYYGANATIALQHDSLFVANVEVDRGPQNTLHGSNADGGILNYISQAPTHSFYAEGRAGVQDYGYEFGEAVVSGPINDKLRFRIGGNYSTQNGGYFRNLDGPPEGGSGPQGNGGKWYYAEGQLDWNVTPNLEAWAMISTGDYNTNFHTVATVGPIPEYEFGGGALAPGSFFGLCGLDNNTGVGCAGPTGAPGSVIPASVHGLPVLANQFPGNNPSTANPHNFIESSHQANTQNRDLALATTWTYHFPSVDLQYIGGYQSFYYHLYFGPGVDSGVTTYQMQGATPGLAAIGCGDVLGLAGAALAGCTAAAQAPLTINSANIGTLFIENDYYWSHELNLQSTGSAPLQWQAGLYWYHEHFDQPIGLDCHPFQAQVINPINGPTNPDACTVNVDGNMTYNDYAGFAHVSYKFNDQWRVEGGIRYTYDQKSGFEQQRIVTLDVALPETLLGAVTPGFDVTSFVNAGAIGVSVQGSGPGVINPATGYIVRPLHGSWSAVTGDVEINWTPDPGTLAYFRYARGYKSGGFNAGVISPVPETQPEYVDDFEIGGKKTFGTTFTLNGALFYYNYYNDQQPFSVFLTGTTTTSTIFNIPQARIYGLELEGVWRPIDPVTLMLQYSYLNAKVTSMVQNGALKCVVDTNDPAATLPGSNTTGCAPGSGGQNLTGETLPEAPANKVSFNAQYAWKFDPGTLTLSGTVVWKDKTFGDIFNRPLQLAPAYSTVNLRASYDDSRQRFTVIAFVNNVFNTLGYDNVTQTNLAPAGSPLALVSAKGLVAPLTFGGEIQVRFR